MKHVRVYTGPLCPYCERAKALLAKKGIAYEEIDVEVDREAMMEVIKKTGQRTIPQIFIDDLHVGGCDELYALEEKGELDTLLDLA